MCARCKHRSKTSGKPKKKCSLKEVRNYISKDTLNVKVGHFLALS